MPKDFDRKIVLEDGSEYLGYGFGGKNDRVCELVFNTAMVGYQEIISDPSCADQMVVMTYPLIGNYGITDEDYEAKNSAVGGLIVRDYNDMPSNFRYTKTLSEELEEDGIAGISGVDTRKLSRAIRNGGTCRAIITSAETPVQDALEIIKNTPAFHDAVSRVSCNKRWYSRTSNHKLSVVAIDCGIKLSMVKNLNARGCNVTVVPYNTTAEEIEFMKPDGVFLSSGPGDPKDAMEIAETVKKLRGKHPIFGVGLGHQLISLSYGADTYKMKFGHRGGNHPVKNLKTGKMEVVNQNHGYAVDAASVEGTPLEITHINTLDNTVEGVCCKPDKVLAVQYEPSHLYDEFIKMMEVEKNA